MRSEGLYPWLYRTLFVSHAAFGERVSGEGRPWGDREESGYQSSLYIPAVLHLLRRLGPPHCHGDGRQSHPPY